MPEPDKPLLWIVDDSPTERAITERALGPRYRFEQFDDGSEVVERLAASVSKPALILCDWVMPGMSGGEVCRYIRTQPATQELPIIVVTSSRVETADVVHGLELGANDYVSKPFAPEELRARVESVLRAKELRDAAQRERTRLDAVNRLGRALFEVGTSIEGILEQLLASLAGFIADGCAITLLPGELPLISAVSHRDSSASTALAEIAMLADPQTYAFADQNDALARLPPKYHAYIRAFGLRGLAILPFPIRAPVQGVITLTRDGRAVPFEPDDLATIETCIEYASLAVQSAVRYDTERAARSQLRAILEHSPVGIVVTDASGGIALINSTVARLIPGIAGATTLVEVFDLASWAEDDGVLLTREAWPFGTATTCKLVTGDRVLAVSSAELPESAGGGRVIAVEDISSEEAMIVERRRVSQFQEQMVGIVGHDLRTPLSAVLLGSEIILERSKEAAVQSTARRLQSSAKRMSSIVDLLLDVTRARLGTGIPIVPVDCDLGAVITNVIEELGSQGPRFDFVRREVHGQWDADRLAQVISNLAKNALQYGNAEAPVRIELGVANRFAQVSVANRLAGDQPISPEQLALMFDPYKRGLESALAHRQGLGLGLYIAYEIVRAHHGKLTATSTTSGTTFVIQLPMTR